MPLITPSGSPFGPPPCLLTIGVVGVVVLLDAASCFCPLTQSAIQSRRAMSVFVNWSARSAANPARFTSLAICASLKFVTRPIDCSTSFCDILPNISAVRGFVTLLPTDRDKLAGRRGDACGAIQRRRERFDAEMIVILAGLDVVFRAARVAEKFTREGVRLRLTFCFRPLRRVARLVLAPLFVVLARATATA